MGDFPNGWMEIWRLWHIRMAVLISLLLQIILILFASRRRRTASKLFAFVLWVAYLIADLVATFALGAMCHSQRQYDCDNNDQTPGSSNLAFVPEHDKKLLAFWAPFLLLHLGGPDTITAFAMEDNELWPRHLLGLFFQVGAAIYVFFLSNIPENPLLAPTLLMFLVGIIKYGERTYALYLASLDGFRNSLLKKPVPGPDYAKLMEQHADMMEQGLEPLLRGTIENFGAGMPNNDPGDVNRLKEAHKLFNSFKGLIVELIFSRQEGLVGRAPVLHKTAQEAFRVVEYELSFMYEVLFTKALVMHHRCGYILRAICSCSIMAAFMSFFFLSKKHRFNNLDVAITYTLLGGAIFLDTFSHIMLILSDWTVIKLGNYSFSKTISDLIFKVAPQNRWSLSVTQHSLINYCIPADDLSYFSSIMDRPTLFGKMEEMLCIQKISRLMGIGSQLIDEIRYTWRVGVTDEDMKHIYEQIKKMATRAHYDLKETWRLCSYRGQWALNERNVDYLKQFGYSIVEVEFDESLLLWHIATDLCFYSEAEATDEEDVQEKRRLCKHLSDYLMYLLVMRPFMMSSSAVIGKIRYRDTCAEATRFFLQKSLTKSTSSSSRIACEKLLSVNTEFIEPAPMKGDRSKSVLFNACILAKKLKNINGAGERWVIVSKVLIEMLTYAAGRCPGIAHAQRLSKGGELLTFVWFLKTHCGLSEQYRIRTGAATVKLLHS